MALGPHGVEIKAEAGSLASLSRTVSRSINAVAEARSTATGELSDLSVVQDDFKIEARGEVIDAEAEILRRLDEISNFVKQIIPLSPEKEGEFVRIFGEKDGGRLGNLVVGRAPNETFHITIEQTAVTAGALREQLASGHLYRETLRLIDAAFKRGVQAIEWWVDILHRVSGDFKEIIGSLTGLIAAITALLIALHSLFN